MITKLKAELGARCIYEVTLRLLDRQFPRLWSINGTIDAGATRMLSFD